jgi:predicted PurR-regulated permease PerM
MEAQRAIAPACLMDYQRDLRSFLVRVVLAALALAAVIAVIAAVWYAAHILLLVFAAVLFAIFLTAISTFVASKTALSRGAALGATVLSLALIAGVAAYLMAPRIMAQGQDLGRALPEAWESLQQWLRGSDWGRWMLTQADENGDLIPDPAQMLAKVPGVFSSTLGTVARLLFVLIVGIYLAAKPRVYTEGILKLLPIASRPRAAEVMSAVGTTLQWWLIGQAIVMSFVGLTTTICLFALGIPLALTLGIIAALFDFVPNIGPIAAAIPAILIAFLQGPKQALYVVVLYVVVQQIESYVISPIVHRRTVSLEPALTLTAQVLLALLLGLPGLILATPLAAAGLVAVKMLYVENVLGDGVDLDGVDKSTSRG